MVLSKCCQEVVSLYWAGLTKWPVGGCMLMPGSQCLPSVDICCVWESCGVCLWLHLNPPSLQLQPCLAEQTSSPARFACINCPCLAHCLLLITLINFNSPGCQYHRNCLQTGTHTQAHTDMLLFPLTCIIVKCGKRRVSYLQMTEWGGDWIRPFSKQPCQWSVNTGVINDINYGPAPFRWARAQVMSMLSHWNDCDTLNRMRPSFILSFTPVFTLVWRAKMAALKQPSGRLMNSMWRGFVCGFFSPDLQQLNASMSIASLCVNMSSSVLNIYA